MRPACGRPPRRVGASASGVAAAVFCLACLAVSELHARRVPRERSQQCPDLRCDLSACCRAGRQPAGSTRALTYRVPSAAAAAPRPSASPHARRVAIDRSSRASPPTGRQRVAAAVQLSHVRGRPKAKAHTVRLTASGPNAWHTGISCTLLMLTCAGRDVTHATASATSSAESVGVCVFAYTASAFAPSP